MNVPALSRTSLFALVLVFVGTFAVSSLQADQPAAATSDSIAELKCPVTPKEKIDPAVFTEYQGKQVFFCCVRCKKKFLADPEKYSLQLAAFDPVKPLHPEDTPTSSAEPAQDGMAHEHPGTDHDHASEAVPETAHATDDHEGHEHQHGDSQTPRVLKWLGNFHPAMTDFPIGVLVAAAVAEMLFIWRKDTKFAHAVRFGVWFAVLTGIVAAVLGWCFGGFRLVDSNPLLLVHRWLGTSTAIWLIVLLWSCERAHRSSANFEHGRTLFRVMLFVGTVLVLVTGFFGGAMVYGLNHYWS